VKEMYLEELVNLVVVVKLSLTLLEMLNLVETCVVNLWRKTLLYSTIIYASDEYTRILLSADILLKRCRYELYITIS
jgi:hypothetical protein